MSKELLLVVDAVANEKGVPREVIFDAMEAALASAAKKRYPDEDPDIRVEIDRNTGDYETFRRWEIVADDVEMEDPSYQIRLMDAEDEAGEGEVAEIGGAIEPGVLVGEGRQIRTHGIGVEAAMGKQQARALTHVVAGDQHQALGESRVEDV
jgi:hypothetical protein